MIEKTYLNQILPAIAAASLSASPIAPSLSDTPSFRSANRKMNAILATAKQAFSEKDFQLKNCDGVAIATDLEPDDVLALAILFKEAHRIYDETGYFPIQLIVVGEGNASIKKVRMKKMLSEFFNIPSDVTIQVVEGKSTQDNLFPFDGEELFEKGELNLPFPESDQAASAIEGWASELKNPLLLQLKPAQELLLIDEEISKKISMLFYGSFNIRKSVEKGQSFQEWTDLLSHRFKKIGILESFGVLGQNSKIGSDERGKKICELIEKSEDPFICMFRQLMDNWNSHTLHDQFQTCKKLIDSRLLPDLMQLEKEWDLERFEKLYNEVSDVKLLRKLELIRAIATARVQFTLSDILVAMACTSGTDLFKANPVRIQFDEHGYIHPETDLDSNVVYYGPTDLSEVISWLEQFAF